MDDFMIINMDSSSFSIHHCSFLILSELVWELSALAFIPYIILNGLTLVDASIDANRPYLIYPFNSLSLSHQRCLSSFKGILYTSWRKTNIYECKNETRITQHLQKNLSIKSQARSLWDLKLALKLSVTYYFESKHFTFLSYYTVDY